MVHVPKSNRKGGGGSTIVHMTWLYIILTWLLAMLISLQSMWIMWRWSFQCKQKDTKTTASSLRTSSAVSEITNKLLATNFYCLHTILVKSLYWYWSIWFLTFKLIISPWKGVWPFVWKKLVKFPYLL